MEIKESILGEVSDMVTNLMYYDRKGDEELKLGDIERAILNNEITFEEMVSQFRTELSAQLSQSEIYKRSSSTT